MSQPSDNQGTVSRVVEASCDNFSLLERRQLLSLAHEAILSKLEGRDAALTLSFPPFDVSRGAFTTVYLHDKLRGCVGYSLAIAPLYRVIAETARGAAFEDARFPPVDLEQARELEVWLSILSPLQTVSPEEVEIGVHGLLVNQGGRRGLLLPQVPLEHGWDRITFLEQTCRKAGLPFDAWQNGATIQVFTAEVFGDRESE